MRIHIDTRRKLGQRDEMLYGQFLEHFHRQVYGGLLVEGTEEEQGVTLRADVVKVLKQLRIPVMRWPGGCFVSSYHWQDGVGPDRQPTYDKSWRVEESNRFGTDEFIRLCREIGCEPYICTNAGTGTPEEMSDWVEYCNLQTAGRYARRRIENGHRQPHRVKYWSIGNENYGSWELGAKTAREWALYVRESAKMMKRVDPEIQLSAAALVDMDWNMELLKACGEYLDWISIHRYWDPLASDNRFADYEQAMAYTFCLDAEVKKVRGLLVSLGLENKIRISFDEWNLRGWHHPNIHTIYQGRSPGEYLAPRDLNDRNCDYTMADAVFSACVLNMFHRNCDIVGMANFAPVLNVRGPLYVKGDALVLRSTYHVFDLYRNRLGEDVLDCWEEASPGENTMTTVDKDGAKAQVSRLDILATAGGAGAVTIAVVNKDQVAEAGFELDVSGDFSEVSVTTLTAPTAEGYNDVSHTDIQLVQKGRMPFRKGQAFTFGPHSVNLVALR